MSKSQTSGDSDIFLFTSNIFLIIFSEHIFYHKKKVKP